MIFEKSPSPGGMIQTSYDIDGIPRELSSAFVFSDYYELSALLHRFKLTQIPIDFEMISYRQSLSNNSADVILSPEEWFSEAIPLVTGSTDMEYNYNLMVTALERYSLIHKEIFGTYTTRLPPIPNSYAKLQELKGSFLDFLQRHDLVVLLPLMFQLFAMKGGPLSSLNPYYGLTWCAPQTVLSFFRNSLPSYEHQHRQPILSSVKVFYSLSPLHLSSTLLTQSRKDFLR
jgi:hypothetical protein